MYVLRCVKSGAFNYDLNIQEGEFVTSLGESTKSLKHAVTFDTKKETGWLRTDIMNRKKMFVFPKNRIVLPARFEIVPVEISIKE